MLRSTVAVPCGEPSRRRRTRAHIRRKRRGKCRPVSDRSAATREPASVLAATSRRKPPRAPRQPPTSRIPCPEAPAPMADSMPHACAPPTQTRPGAPWTRRVARRQAPRKGCDTFSGSSPHALRARTTRKTAVGRFRFPRPTSLPPLPARPRGMRLTRRKARHGGGPPSLRTRHERHEGKGDGRG